ncbi:MAG: type II toxin-antitoxin system Phd/YefM family antitoxin, partial [Desulfobacula sp.]
MSITHPILADVSAGISELKKNPMAVVRQGDGAPVAILNRNEPVFYAIPAKAFELLMDKLEDMELASI